MNNKMTLN